MSIGRQAQDAAGGKARSDRRRTFIGHWTPTFMALDVALRLEEK